MAESNWHKARSVEATLVCPVCGEVNHDDLRRNMIRLENRDHASCDVCGTSGPLEKFIPKETQP